MPLPNNSELEASPSTSSSEGSHFIDIEKNIQSAAPNSKLAIVVPEALSSVIKYYLDGKGHPRLPKVLLDQFQLSLVALTGAGLYGEASDNYAVSIGSELAGRINYIVCTCVTALVVLYNSTELFLVMRRAENIPKELVPYLTNSTIGIKKALEDIAIFTGAAISALPLAAVSFMYPIPGFSKKLLAIQGVIVLIDNTILHLFPLKLALSEPLYRLPSLPFEFIIQRIMTCRLSVEEKEKRQLQAQINLHYNAIIQRFVGHLDLAQKRLSIYMKEVKGDIAEIKKSHPHDTELLVALLDHLRCTAFSERPRATLDNVRNILRTMSYLPGALWVMSSCAGFLAAPINEMTELTGSSAIGAMISTPPIYFLGVLLAFFGGNALQNTFDYFTDWKDEAVKIPMSFKLYPKTATLLIIISTYLALFSYAAGAQLINDNFKGDLEFLRPHLLILAETGLSFLSFTAMIDFFNNTLNKFAQYSNHDDAGMVIKLFSEFDQIKNTIPKMKPSLLLESLALQNKKQLKTLLNIREEETDQKNLNKTLIQLAEKLKTKIIKEVGLINADYADGGSLSTLISKLERDNDYRVVKIEALLAYFDKLELNLLSSLKEDCQQYKSICKLMKKLGSVSLARELNIFPYDSSNDGNLAGSSSETTRLLPRTPYRGSILARFFHRPYENEEERVSSLSTSLQMGV